MSYPSLSRMHECLTVSAGFDWTVLPKNSLVVDVGGGVGSTTLNLLNAHKHLRYIVQDRAPAIKDAQKV